MNEVIRVTVESGSLHTRTDLTCPTGNDEHLMVEVPLVLLSVAGIGTLGHWLGCLDCALTA